VEEKDSLPEGIGKKEITKLNSFPIKHSKGRRVEARVPLGKNQKLNGLNTNGPSALHREKIQ